MIVAWHTGTMESMRALHVANARNIEFSSDGHSGIAARHLCTAICHDYCSHSQVGASTWPGPCTFRSCHALRIIISGHAPKLACRRLCMQRKVIISCDQHNLEAHVVSDLDSAAPRSERTVVHTVLVGHGCCRSPNIICHCTYCIATIGHPKDW